MGGLSFLFCSKSGHEIVNIPNTTEHHTETERTELYTTSNGKHIVNKTKQNKKTQQKEQNNTKHYKTEVPKVAPAVTQSRHPLRTNAEGWS